MWEEKWHKASTWCQMHIHIHTGQRRYGQVKLLLRVNDVSQITWGILTLAVFQNNHTTLHYGELEVDSELSGKQK